MGGHEASSLATIAATWAVLVVLPGPNFLAVGHAAMASSRRTGLRVALGVALGTAIWSTAALVGVAALLRAAGWLERGVALVGAAYLIAVGLRLVAAGRREEALAADAGEAPRRPLLRGIATDLSNPKAAAFFTGLFAAAVPVGAPLWFDGLLVATVTIIAAAWYALAASLLAVGPIAARYRRVRRWLGMAAGATFVLLGIRIAAD